MIEVKVFTGVLLMLTAVTTLTTAAPLNETTVLHEKEQRTTDISTNVNVGLQEQSSTQQPKEEHPDKSKESITEQPKNGITGGTEEGIASGWGETEAKSQNEDIAEQGINEIKNGPITREQGHSAAEESDGGAVDIQVDVSSGSVSVAVGISIGGGIGSLVLCSCFLIYKCRVCSR